MKVIYNSLSCWWALVFVMGFFFSYLEIFFSFVAITFYKSNPTAFIMLQNLLSYLKILIIYKLKVGSLSIITCFLLRLQKMQYLSLWAGTLPRLPSTSKRALCNPLINLIQALSNLTSPPLLFSQLSSSGKEQSGNFLLIFISTPFLTVQHYPVA